LGLSGAARLERQRRSAGHLQRTPARGDVISVLFILFLLCLLAFSFYWFPRIKLNVATGFGPDRDCTAVPNGEQTSPAVRADFAI
jgi:hypothetical protein